MVVVGSWSQRMFPTHGAGLNEASRRRPTLGSASAARGMRMPAAESSLFVGSRAYLED